MIADRWYREEGGREKVKIEEVKKIFQQSNSDIYLGFRYIKLAD